MIEQQAMGAMSSPDLLATARDLVEKARGCEADLLVVLGEIDERKLYLDHACPSMFQFCTRDYGFSEDVAWNRIAVARAARRFPLVLEALRTGKVHLAGLRVLAQHLTADNHRDLLDAAAGKTRREIEELVAGISPVTGLAAGSLGAAYVMPFTNDLFRFHFTGTRSCRDKLREAQGLLRHRVPDGDVGTIFEMALDALIAQVKKERFAVGRKPRVAAAKTAFVASSANKPSKKKPSRHIPAAVRRAVYERDGGRCTFTDESGRRCRATSPLQFHHVDGFAKTGRHDVDRLRLVCRAHNQHAADKMYGRAFMDQARASRQAPSKIATGPPS